MHRFVSMAVGLVVIVATTTRDAQAQWRYGGWGWGGWGQTVEGAALQGAASYVRGAGIYNYDTAMANSINADTMMRLNEYWGAVTHAAAMRHALRVRRDAEKTKDLYDARIQDLRDRPGKREIENGDALNIALADLSDPRLGSSALRAADQKIPADLVAEIPFQNASERATIVLDELHDAFNWPEIFDEPRFADAKKNYEKMVDRIRKENLEGEVSTKTINEAKAFVRNLKKQLQTEPLKDEDDQRAAMRFVNSATAIVGLLDKPDIREALSKLRDVKDTHLSNLLGFMNAYNLRFGVAKTLKQRRAYQALWPVIGGTRNEILAAAKLDSLPGGGTAKRSRVDELYGSFDETKARRRPNQQAPEPPPARKPE